MQCSEAHEAVNALIDGENLTGNLSAAAAHLSECPLCTERARDYLELGDQLRLVANVGMSPSLGDRVRARLVLENTNKSDRPGIVWRNLARQAAALFLVAGLSGVVGWQLADMSAGRHRLEQDLVAAHARALLQDSAVQIASSQSHTVKPWFNGRVEFAVPVKDLSAEGFPLVGGRLDFVGNQRVAALVYKRRLHVINVFVWPAGATESKPPKTSMLNGFNSISWTAGGMTYWAITDLNARELGQLQSLL